MNTQLSSNNRYSVPYEVYEKLSEKIDDSEGNIDTEIEDGEMLLMFKGWYEVDGTVEDDYYNGTGASYLTYANVCLSCTAYDAEGDEVETNYSDREFENFLLD